jgi:hypothetical protein
MFCFSPHSIKLTTVVQWYLRLAIVLARDYDEVHLHAVQRLNTSGRVYGWIVILKNCIAFMRHMEHSMHLVNWNLHLVTGSNSSFERTSSIPRYSCPNHHRTTSVFHIWNQAFKTMGFLRCCPNRYPAWCQEQHGRLIWPYYVSPVIRRPGFMIITPHFSPQSVIFGNQKLGHWSCIIGYWNCEDRVRFLFKQGL